MFVDKAGEVRGFIGMGPRRMVLRGRTIEAAAAGSLMVDRPQENPDRRRAAAALVPDRPAGSILQRDRQRRLAAHVGEGGRRTAGRQRASTGCVYCAPPGFAVAIAGKALRPGQNFSAPLPSGLDRLIAASGRNPLPPVNEATGLREADATSAEIAAIIPKLSDSYALHPDWQTPGLPFLLAHAESKERYGKLYRRIVYDRRGEPAGCYLYYGRRGEIARVLQVLTMPGAAGLTLDSLLRHAKVSVALPCAAAPRRNLLDALLERRCILFHVSAMVVHARDKALLTEVRSSRAMLTGLAGESWTRLIGGEFA